MSRKMRAVLMFVAILGVLMALVAPTAFAGCVGCNNGGQVFSAPVYSAPQILAAPVYQQPAIFAAPVYQQRAVVAAAPVYAAPAAVVQKQVFVQRAQRQPLFGFRSRSVQKNVVRGNAAAAVVY